MLQFFTRKWVSFAFSAWHSRACFKKSYSFSLYCGTVPDCRRLIAIDIIRIIKKIASGFLHYDRRHNTLLEHMLLYLLRLLATKQIRHQRCRPSCFPSGPLPRSGMQTPSNTTETQTKEVQTIEWHTTRWRATKTSWLFVVNIFPLTTGTLQLLITTTNMPEILAIHTVGGGGTMNWKIKPKTMKKIELSSQFNRYNRCFCNREEKNTRDHALVRR